MSGKMLLLSSTQFSIVGDSKLKMNLASDRGLVRRTLASMVNEEGRFRGYSRNVALFCSGGKNHASQMSKHTGGGEGGDGEDGHGAAIGAALGAPE